MFLQAFRDGDDTDADAVLLDGLIRPHLASMGEETGCATLTFADGRLDLHGLDDLGSGFMVNHVEGEAAYGFLVDVASQADLAILPVGCPTAVCGDHLLAHLPDELRDDVVVVRTGADLLDLIRTA